MYSPGLGKHGAICKTEAKREGPGSARAYHLVTTGDKSAIQTKQKH